MSYEPTEDATPERRAGEACSLPGRLGVESLQVLIDGVDRCPIPIFVIDRDHVITHWNKALARSSGFAAADMIGTRNAWAAFYPQPRPTLADLVLELTGAAEIRRLYGDKVRPSTLTDDGFVGEDIFPQWAGGGTWRAFTAAPLYGPDGTIKGAIETLEDISDRKEAESRLQAHQAQLEELVLRRTEELSAANGELVQYAYIVSHDLRAPLRAIRNYTDFLVEDLAEHVGAREQECVDGIYRALGEGERLIADLLDYATVSEKTVDPVPIDCAAFLRSLAASMALPPEVELSYAPDLPMVLADPVLLGQTFRNLIANAAKFNEAPNKAVEIGWLPSPGERVELFVRDRGIGIDPRHVEKIFDVFQRLHSEREYAGTGIGLAIVKKSASRLGGAVRVESTPGRGSTFYVALTPARNANLPRTAGSIDEE